MKQKLFSLLLMAFIPIAMMAEDVTIDGINYSVIKKTKQAEVISGGSYTGNITIPETVVYEDDTYSVTRIGSDAFNNSRITSITIPSSVTSIGYKAFYDCIRLTSVTIPEGVTSIESYAFKFCTKLTSVIIPSSVTSMGSDVFTHCTKLTSVTFTDGVTSIGDYTFTECPDLTSVTIPSSVTSIGDGVFNGCSGLTSVTIPEGVTSIGRGAFLGCSGLTSITIPSSVTSIGYKAFYDCSGLTSITIPEGVTSIGSGVFSGCSGLTSISVASGNTYYDSRNNCNAIIETSTNTLVAGCKSTVIPSSVTSIEEMAFRNHIGLTSITIPEGVTSIGLNAFANCENLEVVTCLATTLPSTVSNSLFGDIFQDSYVEYATLIIPDEAYDAYSTTAPWSNFGTKLKLSEATVVTANSYTREYGEPNPTFEYTSGTILNGTPEITCEADENSPAGTYPITISQGSVTNPGLIFYNGTLTVTKAPLTITAKDYTVTVGDAMPTFEAEYEGFKNSDDETILTTAPSFSCAATNTDTEGIYDITVSGAASDRYDITYAKGQLAIVPTEVVITISSAGMATYCSPYDLDFSGVKNLKAYIISGYDWANKKVFATRVYDVPAGTGLYLVGQQGEYHVNIGSTSCYYINMLVGTTSSITLEPTDGDVTNLILTGTSPQNASFKTLAASRNFGANKAYLQIPTSVLSSSANAVGIIFDDETNGIESISGMGHANGDWFTIDGRRLNSMPVQKGVYILNGNKIVIK